MPRKRPKQLRAADQRPATTQIPGVPLATSQALDRLDQPEVSSERVARAVEGWQRTTSRTRAELSAPNSDWTEFIGPDDRGVLENALLALPPRHAARLRVVVERADSAFAAKTLPNPRVEDSQPWWARRWWH